MVCRANWQAQRPSTPWPHDRYLSQRRTSAGRPSPLFDQLGPHGICPEFSDHPQRTHRCSLQRLSSRGGASLAQRSRPGLAQRRIPTPAWIHSGATKQRTAQIERTHPGDSAPDWPQPARSHQHGSSRRKHVENRLRCDSGGCRHPHRCDQRVLGRASTGL